MQAHDRWADPEVITDPLLQSADILPPDHPLFEDRAFWDYAKTTYDQWYNENKEEFPEADMELEAVYGERATTCTDDQAHLQIALPKHQWRRSSSCRRKFKSVLWNSSNYKLPRCVRLYTAPPRADDSPP
jgi:hypothetical protein